MIAATRAKIGELKNDLPGRPVILIGWNTGGAVACQVSKQFLCRYVTLITD
jgi:thioesterase domain-containing protein